MKFLTLCFLVAVVACAMCVVVEGGKFLRSPEYPPEWMAGAREARPCTLISFLPYICE
uniref:2-CB domain n=1 Tax=Argas monolakensis TaxID=34602 RepID=Q09JU0_ARGMO|nr:2-CB domain [Argas monolakensis]